MESWMLFQLGAGHIEATFGHMLWVNISAGSMPKEQSGG